MIALPALDLSGGSAVQWVGGSPAHERVRLPSPPDVAAGFRDLGFAWLHVVDLDAALGRGDPANPIAGVLGGTTARTQVGGGVRDQARAEALFARGAERVVVGTRAVRDPAWLERLAGGRPGRVVVAADVRGERVTAAGWTEDAGVDLAPFVESLAGLPLAAVLVTDVDREGAMGGVDADRFGRLATRCPHPLIAAGGIRALEDIRALAAAGTAGVVIGMALYTGAIDARALAREFGRDDGGLGPPLAP
ncbi:MAG: 1-(5-phosphoribosyl)-5-[(5-phosphoribosylamino)methylideneamino] imidazole-4-carboxamide isomerase, partial [Gemmatimonadota bacterium]